MDAVIAMFRERPYVIAFLVSFLVIAWSERGWQRTLLWLANGTFIGWAVEFSSTHNGFPFGHYAYHESNFPDELFIGGIPFFASLSFAFLTYFGYSAACTMLSPLARRGRDIVRLDRRADGSLRVLALAALLTTWADTVTDPVAHLGKHWFLGDLYAYHARGIHFDVPLTNYAGWLFTSLVIVFVNQRFDGRLRARSIAARGFALPLQPLWAIGSLIGNLAFIISISAYLLAADRAPGEPLGAVLASGVALSVAFVAFASLMVWRGLRSTPSPPAPLPQSGRGVRVSAG
jgi:uncharacterized membrane protein